MSPARHKPATAEATYLWRIQYFRSAKGGTVFAPTAAFLKFSACVFSREARKVHQSVLIKQTTIAAPAETSGLGLHTAVPVRVRLRPAPPDNGLVFVRTDLDDFEINASVECIAHCSYATTLMRTGVMLSTVEHLLAALRGLGVDNAYIEVDNLEVPIMDGSAESFAEMIESASLVEQPAARRALLDRVIVVVNFGND